MSETVDQPQKKSGGGRGCMLIVAGIIALVVVGCLNPFGKDRETTPEAAKIHARDTCRDAVKKGLKSPSTAQFSGEESTIKATTSNGYEITVRGVVEAGNSFGGMVGHDFTCSATVTKGGDVKAKVTSIQER